MRDRPQTERWTTRFGEVLTLRPLGVDDVGRSQDFLRALSFGSRYFRFGKGDFVYTDEELDGLCRTSTAAGLHLVATHVAAGRESIVGSARWVALATAGECEFTTVVGDAWQRRGIGHRLMRELIDDACGRGMQRMVGKILATNRGMINFIESLGFEFDIASGATPIRLVSLRLAPRSESAARAGGS